MFKVGLEIGLLASSWNDTVLLVVSGVSLPFT